MSRPSPKEGVDPELGPVRRCPRCPPGEDWWPDDEEFFYTTGGRRHAWCRACYLEAKAVYVAAARARRAA